MDLEILKKRISSFRTDGGRVKNVSDELVMEILSAWERWTGPAKGFAVAIGMNRGSIPKLIGKAKRLRREGHFPVEDFKEIKIDQSPTERAHGLCAIEISWENGKLIRFALVEQLVDFLKKVA